MTESLQLEWNDEENLLLYVSCHFTLSDAMHSKSYPLFSHWNFLVMTYQLNILSTFSFMVPLL